MSRLKIILLMVFMFFSVSLSETEMHSENPVTTDYQTGNFSHCQGLRTVAENASYKLIVYDETAIFGLQDKSNNYIWWSSPLEDLEKTDISPVEMEKLKSSAILKYGEVEKRTDNNFLRSGSNACTVGVEDIDNGIRIDYNYESYGFHFYIDYTLESDHLKASLKTSEIVEKDKMNISTELNLLGSFGASDNSEKSQFIIPDGCGAVINLNDQKKNISYRKKIYGDDLTAVPEKQYSISEQIYLPMFSIVHENNALIAVASKGDSNAFITAETFGNYNTCSFTFVLRNTDTYYMSGKSTERLTVFENGKIESGDIEVLYYPIAKKDVSYVDVAECYRNYLLDNRNIKPVTEENYSPLYINFYGGTEKKKSVFGIPLMRKQVLTSYHDAEKILKEINPDNAVILYTNWTDNSIKNKIDTNTKPSSALGGKKDFCSLVDLIESKKYEFYPLAENIEYYSGMKRTSATVRTSGVYAKIPDYNVAYGFPDSYRKERYLLSPEYFVEITEKVNKNYSGAGLNGVAFGKFTSSLYGDYGKTKITRFKAMENIIKSLSETDINILANGANAYSLPFVKQIVNVPLNSSGYDIFDEDIPFYQIVLHGIIPYTSKAVNSNPNTEDMLLMSAVTGSNLYYDLISTETDVLKDTEYGNLYYANADYWTNDISEQYKLISPILESVSNSTIVDYKVENSGDLITAQFSNGNIVKADFIQKTITFNDNVINLG